MNTTNTLANRAALIAVLVLGSSAWVSAQSAQPNQGRSGQPGSGLNSQQNRYSTNSQYTPGQSGQAAGALGRQQNSYGTNSQYNQGRSGQTAGSQNRQDSYGATSTNSHYNQGRSGQAGSELGRQQSSYGTNSQSQPQDMNKGSSLIGTTVKNQQGESLGKITDLVIDLNSERVSYVVLDSGAGIFNAQKLHAVPLRAFKANSEGTELTLNADKAKLESSEGFTKENWPTLGTATWGAEPAWKDSQDTEQDSVQKRALEQHYNQDEQDQDSKDATKELKKNNSQQTPRSRP